MKKTEEQKQQILKEQWYKRNPCHDKDQNGVDRFWGTVLCVLEDYNKALTLTDVSQQRELLAISCLNNIIQPIDYLKQLAELDGGKLDGSFAVHLTKQGMFYQELAKKAIKEIDNCG